jgi:hypothetical protein
LLVFNALDAFCISSLGDATDHRDVDADLALALSMETARGTLTGCTGDRFGVTGRGELAGCCAGVLFGVIERVARPAAGDCGGIGDPLEEDGLEMGDGEVLRRDELTVGRRKDGTGLSDDAGNGAGLSEARAGRRDVASELDGRALDDVGLPPLVLTGRVLLLPSRDPGVDRVAMGCFCCQTNPKILSNDYHHDHLAYKN